jgi:hypothetical protein
VASAVLVVCDCCAVMTFGSLIDYVRAASASKGVYSRVATQHRRDACQAT